MHAGQPPVYIVHGDADPQVSLTQSQKFYKRCQELDVKCELRIRHEAGHGGWQEMLTEDTPRMAEWFDLQLLGKQPKVPFTYGVTTLPSTPVKKVAK
jgi:fermentation-respiration switch protein FrsA (DUF1100 family)